MKCPQCQVALLMTERKGVEIDYCGQCRGVWLDRGELDKIIDLSTAERVDSIQSREQGDQERKPKRAYSNNDRHTYVQDDTPYRKGKPYRKKGIMHQIFDIFD